MSGNDRVFLFDGHFSPGITVDGEAGTDTLILAEPLAVDLAQGRIIDVEKLRGSEDNDSVRMTADQFLAFDRIHLQPVQSYGLSENGLCPDPLSRRLRWFARGFNSYQAKA